MNKADSRAPALEKLAVQSYKKVRLDRTFTTDLDTTVYFPKLIMGCKTYHQGVRIARIELETLRVFSYNISVPYTERLKIFSCNSRARAQDNTDCFSAVIFELRAVRCITKKHDVNF